MDINKLIEEKIKKIDNNVNYDEADLGCEWGKPELLSFIRQSFYSLFKTYAEEIIPKKKSEKVTVQAKAALKFRETYTLKDIRMIVIGFNKAIDLMRSHHKEMMKKGGVDI